MVVSEAAQFGTLEYLEDAPDDGYTRVVDQNADGTQRLLDLC